MDERKPDIWDSVGKVGGIVAAGIFGSVFLPSIVAWLISDWIAEQLAENPSQLLLCCALALAAGAGLACSISVPLFKRRVFRAEKDADAKSAAIVSKDAEIAELKQEIEKMKLEIDLDSLEAAFCSLPFRAKMLCAGIWQNGGLERERGDNMPGDAERSAAKEAGFIVEEETSEFGRVRFSASKDLSRLFSERPGTYEQVLSDFARGTYRMDGGRLVRVK